MGNPKQADNVIKIILVDDIAETRESIKKLLAFEQDFKVVGTAGNGREGVAIAKELKPDIIIMDINMPDMDGLEAAGLITKAVPTAGVIMMSVQDDADYMQKAMLAGARFFLTKPVGMDQLYGTIRNVYAQYGPIRDQFKMLMERQIDLPTESSKKEAAGGRAGNILCVYSPQGGAGTTTIATSLASGLMKEGVKTLLIDANVEFGDVGTFLNLKSPTTLVDLVENAEDLDIEYFDSVVSTHNSGLKVLLGPARPALGMEIRDSRGEVVSTIIQKIAGSYDFIVIDMGKSIDALSAPILQIATKIILVAVPSLTCVKNIKLVLDLFDQSEFPPEKTALIINKASDNPKTAKLVPSPERIQAFLKRPVEGLIPLVDEAFILNAIQTGVPVVASDRDITKAPIKQLLALADHFYSTLLGIENFAPTEEPKEKNSSWSLFGKR
jgi:pilus assembly protein CpaE